MSRKTQSKRKKDIVYYPEQHVRDVNSREIFKNDRLTSQFLRNYTNISLFANVQPEDIEDVSRKYRAFLGVEYESDTIKKVYIRKTDGTLEREVYVISLIEHKSDIDYDVAMQLLRYMTAIWQEYKKSQDKKVKESSKRKSFRYPLIIPIVYYEGAKRWTADLHLKDRIEFAEQMEKYIPDFTYQVVSVNEYTNEELSKKHDEMSLVMLINKIQTPKDYEEFCKVSEQLVNSIYGNAPEEIKEIYRDILWSLLMKMNVPSEDARELMGEIGGCGMGYLFENMEKMDIQAERRNTQREKERADRAEERANRAEEEIQRLKQQLAQMQKNRIQ
ncbi:Rpn family recombination-promoting nuclease/putative transposase [Blautia sp. HCP3S3_H10_1]|uniref:Rpn family recombination-promoting nuclease/putative transposase n=1 Tax=unclassified Blautia TaxID=2648079 RepID=UPI003F8F5B62